MYYLPIIADVDKAITCRRNFPLRVLSMRWVARPEGKWTTREPHLGFLGCEHSRNEPRTSSASSE